MVADGWQTSGSLVNVHAVLGSDFGSMLFGIRFVLRLGGRLSDASRHGAEDRIELTLELRSQIVVIGRTDAGRATGTVGGANVRSGRLGFGHHRRRSEGKATVSGPGFVRRVRGFVRRFRGRATEHQADRQLGTARAKEQRALFGLFRGGRRIRTRNVAYQVSSEYVSKAVQASARFEPRECLQQYVLHDRLYVMLCCH
jgi:hypothetical protein